MMKNDQLDNLLRQWASLGVGFDIQPASGAIDVERLLLETSRHIPSMPRLFIMAATWLHAYGDLIAKHRLKRLIRDELEAEFQPILGLLLDTAQQGTHPLEFQSVIKNLKAASSPRALFETASQNRGLTALAKRKASPLAKKWNLWCQEIEFKDDALRQASWTIANHPTLRTRADFRGDLRASILAALRHDEDAGQSESRLAELAGGSRAQVRAALRNLEITGRVQTRPALRENRRETFLTSEGEYKGVG